MGRQVPGRGAALPGQLGQHHSVLPVPAANPQGDVQTNAIESPNMVMRNLTRNRRIFPNDDYALKSLFCLSGRHGGTSIRSITGSRRYRASWLCSGKSACRRRHSDIRQICGSFDRPSLLDARQQIRNFSNFRRKERHLIGVIVNLSSKVFFHTD